MFHALSPVDVVQQHYACQWLMPHAFQQSRLSACCHHPSCPALQAAAAGLNVYQLLSCSPSSSLPLLLSLLLSEVLRLLSRLSLFSLCSLCSDLRFLLFSLSLSLPLDLLFLWCLLTLSVSFMMIKESGCSRGCVSCTKHFGSRSQNCT